MSTRRDFLGGAAALAAAQTPPAALTIDAYCSLGVDREYDLTESELVAAMDRAKVDRAVIAPVDRYLAVDNREGNDRMLAVARRNKRLIAATEGPYRLRKLRYQVVPGFWSVALLYEPRKVSGRAPAILSANGHEPGGKAEEYIQKRCINQAIQGMVVLHPEWIRRPRSCSAWTYTRNLTSPAWCAWASRDIFAYCLPDDQRMALRTRRW